MEQNGRELLNVNQDVAHQNKQRVKCIRQERVLISENDSCTININEKSFEVFDYTLYGLSIISNDVIKNVKNLQFVPFHFNDELIGEFQLKHLRTEKVDQQKYKTVFSVCEDEIPVEKIYAIQIASRIEEAHCRRVDLLTDIPNRFRRIVFEIKSLLLKLREDVDLEESKLNCDSIEEQNIYDNVIAEKIGDTLDKYFSPIYSQFADEVVSELSGEQLRKCFNFFQRELFDLIQHSKFAKRSIEKPRGYAGDFQMMNIIYDNQAVGESLFSKAIHKYYLNHPNAKAVRNRSVYLYNKLRKCIESQPKGERIKILSLASGPAKEIQMLIEKCHNELNQLDVEIVLCDLDSNALMHSQRRIRRLIRETGCKIKVSFCKQNILRLRKEGVQGFKNEKFDFIYSAGVFDYIKDAAAGAIVEYLYELLRPEGEIVIGNFTIDRGCAALMVLALDWSLIYRSKKDLKDMYEFVDPEVKIEEEEEGINLFAILRN